MRIKPKKSLLACALSLSMAVGGLAFAADNAGAETAELVDLQTEWRYLDDNTDPSGEGERTAWTLADFDDSSWKTSDGHSAKFGAKNGAITDLGNDSTPEILLKQYIDESGNDIPTYFFRTDFDVESVEEDYQLVGTIKYDDAAIVYVNGTKIAAFDEPEGGFETNLSYGGSNDGDPKEATFTTDAAVLHSGKNVIAIEVHQGRETSSDIYFELSSLKLEKASYEQNSISVSIGADETQMNFTWYCNWDGNGEVLLAKASELVDGEMPQNAKRVEAAATASNRSGYYSNQATVTGLERNTVYAYQLVNGNTKSNVMTFNTNDSADAFSFAFVGDPQIGAGNRATDTVGWDNTLNIIRDNAAFDGVDFILSAGDQVNTASNELEYNGYLEHDALTGIPVATVVGNHDSSSNAYNQHFNMPNESEYGATAASSDYYFVYNNVLFMALNSNNRSTAEHKTFMENAIAETENQNIKWKIVTFHHSIYTVASHAADSDILQRRNELVPVFKELDIDAVLMGHDHVYCRTYMMDGFDPMTDVEIYDNEDYSSITNPEGILYITANSASGSKFYNIQTNMDLPYSKVMNQEKVPNVSKVDVTADSFTITTYRTNDMSVIDTFTINHMSDESQEEPPVIKSGWEKTEDGNWVFYQEGELSTGWIKDGGKWYYLDTNGNMKTGWVNDGGKWYYMASSGTMSTGWKQIKDVWYYFGTNGIMVDGWKMINNKWYYFNNGAMVDGWKKINNKWYYFNDGAMVDGWKKIDGKWYYFDDGAMIAGWKKLDNKWYYFGTNGAMISNKTITINGKQYTFNASGAWVK